MTDKDKLITELKAKNAELEAKIKKYAAINEQETKDYAELEHTLKLQEQENVRLREKFNNLISTPIYENCNLLLEQKRRLEKCLQEIKEIAEKLMADNLCNNCDGIGLDANCQDTGCPYYQMDAILQKITKAEEE